MTHRTLALLAFVQVKLPTDHTVNGGTDVLWRAARTRVECFLVDPLVDPPDDRTRDTSTYGRLGPICPRMLRELAKVSAHGSATPPSAAPSFPRGSRPTGRFFFHFRRPVGTRHLCASPLGFHDSPRGRRVELGGTIHGGRRHRRARAAGAIAVAGR